MNALVKMCAILNLSVKNNLVEFTTTHSSLVILICRALLADGFIRGFYIVGLQLTIKLSFVNKRPVLKQLKLISKPGRKVFVSIKGVNLLQTKFESLNVTRSFTPALKLTKYFISSNKGVIDDSQAQRICEGGELLCYVYI